MKRIIALILAILFGMLTLTSCSDASTPPNSSPVSTPSAPTPDPDPNPKPDPDPEPDPSKKLPDVLKSVDVDPMFSNDPAEDGELNVLLIGNSYSYYWLDELWALLNAAGYKNARICNVYYSGCKFEQHWSWYANGEKNYLFQIWDGTVRKTRENAGLEECMSYANWDIISFQQSGTYMYGGGTENGPARFENSVYEDLPELYRLMYKNFPHAEFCWIQHWVHEIGSSPAAGITLEAQNSYHEAYKSFSYKICEEYGLTNVPLGEAWQSVRHDPMFFELGSGDYPVKTLHTRVYTSAFKCYKKVKLDDLSHDGDIGGGQYLNACVWFEVITHRSVVGNSFRPSYTHTYENKTYTFTEEQILLLQRAAHSAVTACHGEGYYN